MDIKTLKREDFHISAGCNGYMVSYKNTPIGGAGIKGKFKGRNRVKQIQDYLEMGKRDVDNIMMGIMCPNVKSIIEKLN